MKKQLLINLQEVLNNNFIMEEEGYSFKIKKAKGTDINSDEIVEVISMEIIEADTKEILHIYNTNKIYETVGEIVKSLISSIYETDINFRNRYGKDFKGAFLSRKMKAMDKAFKNNDNDKINEINTEMMERYQIVEKYKSEVEYYKRFVRLLFSVVK